MGKRKLEIKNNSLVITNVDNSQEVFDFLASEVYYSVEKLNKDNILDIIKKSEASNSPVILYSEELGNLIDSNDVDYTKQGLKDFCRRELGKYNLQVRGNVIDVYNSDYLERDENNVIQLKDNTAYVFKSNLNDLKGARLVGGNNTSISGTSSETTFITSTGLGAGVPLFTTQYTTPIEKITFKDIDTAVQVNGNSSTALDWDKFNIQNCPNIGEVNGCANWILTNSAFLNSKGLVFKGSIDTIGISGCIFTGDGFFGDIIKIDANCTVNRRFRPIYSSFVAFGDTRAINVDDLSVIPIESYILDTINFSGGGTYLDGVKEDDNRTLFVNCVGIVNTSVNGQLYMRGNSTATTISDTTNFFKVLGITTPSIDNSKYSHQNNRLTCEAEIERKYFISCTLSFSSGNNNVCEFGFYDSKLNEGLGGIREPSITPSTANSAGRAESVNLSCVVQHNKGDYLEIHCRNTDSLTSITVTEMNFTIIESK